MNKTMNNKTKDDPRIVELRKFTSDMSGAIFVVFAVFLIALIKSPICAVVWLCVHYLLWTIFAIIIWEKTYVGKYQ